MLGLHLGFFRGSIAAAGSSSTPVAMTNVGGYSLVGDAENGYTVTRTGASGYAAGPYSDPLNGDFVARYDLNSQQGARIGVYTVTNWSDLVPSLELDFDGGGNTSRPRKDNAYNGVADPNASTSFFWMRRPGPLVEALRNTVDDIDTATVEQTHTISGTVYVIACVASNGASATIKVTET